MVLETVTALMLTAGAAHGQVRIDGGEYRPVFPPTPAETVIAVKPFLLDKTPVTNAQFLDFLKHSPRWRRDQLPRVFADAEYLMNWEGALALGKNAPADAPVVRVSWFAARAYCSAQGARLPTEAEWELAAAADEKEKDARGNPEFIGHILQWYSQPTPATQPAVGRSKANVYGIHDLHGLVWEWVLDFGNTILSNDSREGSKDGSRFCGAGAVAQGDKRDYAAFMRVAYRGSLKATYTVANLGFRCARDIPEVTP